MPILFGLFYALRHLGQSPTGYPDKVNWAKSACDGHQVSNWTQWFHQCYSVHNMPGHADKIFDLFHAQFLWLSNGLGGHDPFYILPLLAGATQWLQSRMMLAKSTDPQQQMMNTMMNFMPLMIVFFALNYASGLSLYWVTSTLIGIAIQYRITGWGLLPRPTQVLALLRRPSTPSRPSTGKGSRLAKPAANPPNVELNGNDGAGTEPRRTAAGAAPRSATQRKKANRARGGRGGGRRG
jgi:YidC/Oxa1 family membrane protein insertase